MHNNPFPLTITDEDSDIPIPNFRAAVWEQGYQECLKDMSALLDKAGLAYTKVLESMVMERVREFEEVSRDGRESD